MVFFLSLSKLGNIFFDEIAKSDPDVTNRGPMQQHKLRTVTCANNNLSVTILIYSATSTPITHLKSSLQIVNFTSPSRPPRSKTHS